MFNLFLDDERKVEDVYKNGEKKFVVAKSSAEAINLVKKYGMPTYMSLDHDLGVDDTTMNFLRWLANENPDLVIGGKKFSNQIPSYKVHSANPVGTQNIISFMNSWEKTKT